MTLPRLVITVGDPAGIGPEVTCKAIASREIYKVCRPIIVGDKRLLKKYALPKNLPYTILHQPAGDLSNITFGQVSVTAGRAAYSCIAAAVEAIQKGNAEGLVTAPICKAALNVAGVRYAGHTELLAALTHSRHYAMLMVAGKLRSVMVTRHIPLEQTGKEISVEAIVDATEIAHRFLRDRAGIKNPRIVVCSLNPHAGEGGLLGKEEGTVILPAVKALEAKKINVTGPLPGDSAWLKAKRREFDLVVAMYHDQTMVPLKCLAPEKIVNVTIGLPFIRTSPGHGTGFDIAGKNCADPRSMEEAIKLAAALSRARR